MHRRAVGQIVVQHRHQFTARNLSREQRFRLQHETETTQRGNLQRLAVVRAKAAGAQRVFVDGIAIETP